MLRKISINNYKIFDNFQMDFTEGVNLICGPNGSGKSALLKLLYKLTKFLAMPDFSDQMARSVEETFPFDSFCRWKTPKKGYGEMSLQIEISDCDDEIFIYDLSVEYDFAERDNRIHQELLALRQDNEDKVVFSFSKGKIEMFTDEGDELSFKSDLNSSGLIPASHNNNKIRSFGEMIFKIISTHLTPFCMLKDFTNGSKSLGMYGENFASWRFYCANNQAERQNWILEQCKNFIPGIVSINNPQKGDMYRLMMRVNYKGNHYDLTFDELSDGQKVLLALYTIIANVPDGGVVMIDEPENFLAPGELQPWLDAMHDAWEDRGIQFIITSHNPKTLNWYHDEAIIFETVGEPPRAVCRKHIEYDTSVTLFGKLCGMEWRK